MGERGREEEVEAWAGYFAVNLFISSKASHKTHSNVRLINTSYSGIKSDT